MLLEPGEELAMSKSYEDKSWSQGHLFGQPRVRGQNNARPKRSYVHKLAIKRSYGGKRLGLRMLQWAEGKARKEGKRYLRLDCLASNKTIRNYYEKAGFVHVRDTEAAGWTASLYQKSL